MKMQRKLILKETGYTGKRLKQELNKRIRQQESLIFKQVTQLRIGLEKYFEDLGKDEIKRVIDEKIEKK
jgi:hypothetical protein